MAQRTIFDEIDIPSDATGFSLIDMAQAGARREELARILHVALIHESYFHENRDLLPQLKTGALEALHALGTTWFDRELVVRLYLDRTIVAVHEIADTRAGARIQFKEFVSDTTALREAILLGRGESREKLSSRIVVRIMFQIIGALVVTNFESIARHLLSSYFEALLSGQTALVDPGAALARIVPPDHQNWMFEKNGPDHATTFTATLTTVDGRTATASNVSKRSARKAAAADFVRLYGTSGISEKKPFTIPRDMELSALQRRKIDVVIGSNMVPPVWRPLLTQAFVHNSWASENKQVVARAQQQANTVLALVGAEILHYEYTRTSAECELENPSDSYANRSQTNETVVAAASLLHVDEAVLLGQGQQSTGANATISATALQAVSAVIYLSGNAPSTLFEVLPAHWDAVRPLLAPRAVRESDPITMLQERLNTTTLKWHYTVAEESGPHHNRSYTVELHMTSLILNSTISGLSAPSANLKVARADAARSINEALDWLSLPVGVPSPRIDNYLTFLREHLDAEDEIAQSAPAHPRKQSPAVDETLELEQQGTDEHPMASCHSVPTLDATERDAGTEDFARHTRAPAQARLTFEILPDRTSTRAFVTERQTFYARHSTRTQPTLDPKRTDLIDELAKRYGPDRCTIYRGFAAPGQLFEVGENITEDYLILVIARKRGEDAIAISPAARRHATYIVRHDVTDQPWHDVFAYPKVDAKDLGARRLVFRDRYPLDQYRSMREKVKALLDCSPRSFPRNLVYQAQRLTYSVQR